MAIVFAYGLLLSLISFALIVSPGRAADLGIRYCHWPHMHRAEILLNALFGLALVYFAGDMKFTMVFRAFGALLLIIALGLALVGSDIHRRYGLWSIEKSRPILRPAAPVSLAFGVFTMYSAV